MIEQGLVTVDGKTVAARLAVRVGMHIKVDLQQVVNEAGLTSKLQPVDLPLEILFEDDALLAVNKPAHMSVHPGATAWGAVATSDNQPTLVHILLHHFKKKQLSDLGGNDRPGILHRLDKDTSGVILIAKNNRVHAALSKQFADRKVEKVYEAIVCGKLPKPHGVINAEIRRHGIHRQKMTSQPLRSGRATKGREAVTEWRVIKQFEYFSHLEVHPKTGRTHQIRVHLADLGFPIVGDKVYGGIRYPKKLPAPLQKALSGLNRQALHARQITFTHPITKKSMTISAPLSADLKELLRQLN